jgi:two-component system KDP operon response regulator KdpE
VTTPAAAPSSRSGSRSAELVVVVIEDDPAVGEVVRDALAVRGYDAHLTTTGRGGLDLAVLLQPDLVVLDLGLPDVDGIDVCRRLRTWTSNPIIVLSADGAEERKVAALDEGADDYVTKPFSMGELLARLRVAERHRSVLASAVDDAVLQVGDLVVDTAAREVRLAGDQVELTRKEYALLELLVRNAGKVLTHGTLLAHVWGRPVGQAGGTESLRVHVTQLRRKLGAGPLRPQLLSDPGTGYRIVVPDPRDPETRR